MGNVATAIRQYLRIAGWTPFRDRWRGKLNPIRVQDGKMAGLAGRTTVGLRAAIFVMVKI